MIPADTFNARLQTCRSCEFWKGVCLRGHKLSSTAGCPLKKFEPIQGAAYATDREPVSTPLQGCGSCHAAPNLTWTQVLTQFAQAMVNWASSGLATKSSADHAARYAACQKCPKLVSWQCTECKCVAYVKAKLSTESCPLNQWPN